MTFDSGTWRLEAGNEWVARDPFGEIKAADRSERCVELIKGGSRGKFVPAP